MKVLVAYYSKGGNTKKVADRLEDKLRRAGDEVDVERVYAKKEHSFWGWEMVKMFRRECPIKSLQIDDLSEYDMIYIGSPNWTRLSLPMTRYLRTIKGLEYKQMKFFATTGLWPNLEWYLLSTYMLDVTLNHIVEERGARLMKSILLSGHLKNWSIDSEYGKKQMDSFCCQIDDPSFSFKKHEMKRKKVSDTRLLINILLALLVVLFGYQGLALLGAWESIEWLDFIMFGSMSLFSYILMLILLKNRVKLNLPKYITGFVLALGWSIVACWFSPSPVRLVLLGYLLNLFFVSLLQEPGPVLITGVASLVGYARLIFMHPEFDFRPSIDVSIIIASTLVIVLISKTLKKGYSRLVEAQDKIEKERSQLEVRVQERTDQLERLTMSLDKQVKDKTVELEDRLAELEKFKKLTVGREIKMVELKKKIKELEKHD